MRSSMGCGPEKLAVVESAMGLSERKIDSVGPKHGGLLIAQNGLTQLRVACRPTLSAEGVHVDDFQNIVSMWRPSTLQDTVDLKILQFVAQELHS